MYKPLENLLAASLLGAWMLGGCSHAGNNSPAAPNPLEISAIAPKTTLSFTRYPLDGLSGPSAVAFPTPPYVVGTANDGGALTVLNVAYIGLQSMYVPPRVAYGVSTADFNGDEVPDVLSPVYSPTNIDSSANLYLGVGAIFSQDPTFGTEYVSPAGNVGYRGRTETVVVADFANSGVVDVFLPTYTYLDSHYDLSDDPSFYNTGPPPNVYNAYQSYLLLNDGTGHFTEHAVEAGVSMHSTLSGLQPPSPDPNGNQPEGAQAVDFNMDGLIDLYAGGHLFINQGVDANGIPHFKDMAPQWGLTQTLLRASPPWATDLIPSNKLVTDEGIKFLDWNNDGHLDLLVFRWNWGPAHGARLFEFNGSQFVERVYALSQPTPTCPTPPSPQTAFFWSSRPYTTGSLAAGINAYDLSNDGLEDVVVSGDRSGSAVFENYGCGFAEVSAGDLAQVPGGNGGMALADIDGDGKIDIIYPEATTRAYYINKTQTTGSSFTVTVVGPNGEHNQYGRVIQVLPPGSPQIFTRVVDGGSGYLALNQYPILVGTPYVGAHTVKVYFAPLTRCVYGGPPCEPAILTFSISPRQVATAYAPSPSYPTGRAVITSGT